jgi:RING-finger-containing ubiquitin ligase
MENAVLPLLLLLGIHSASAMELDTKQGSAANVIPTLRNLSLHAIARACLMPVSLENINVVHDTLEKYEVAIAPEDFKDIATTYGFQLNKQALPICCMSELKTENRSFSPDGSYIALNTYTGQYIFDVKELKLYPLEKAQQFARFKFSPKGTYLYQWMAGDKEKYGVWDTKTKKLLKIFTSAEYREYGDPITTADETYLILETPQGTSTVYDFKTLCKVGEIPHSVLKKACVSPDCSRIAIPRITVIDDSKRTTTYVYQMPSGELLTVLEGGDAVAFSPNGKYIATESYTDRPTRRSCLRIYDNDGRHGYYPCIQQYEREKPSWPEQITFSKDSTKVMTVFFNSGGYSVWDIAQESMIFSQERDRYGKDEHLSQLLICDDMTKVVEVDNLYRAILMVKALDGKVLQQTPINKLQNFRCTPDGKHLLSCAWEGSTLYNLDNLNDYQVITSRYGDTQLSPNGAFCICEDELLFLGTSASLTRTFKDLLASLITGETLEGYFSHVEHATAKAIAIKKILHDNAITRPKSYGLNKRFVIDDGYTPTVYDTQSDHKMNFAWNIYEDVSKNNTMEEFLEKTWNDAENTCTICLEPNIDQITQCKHVFHKDCLKQWLTQHKSCPTCRYDLKK